MQVSTFSKMCHEVLFVNDMSSSASDPPSCYRKPPPPPGKEHTRKLRSTDCKTGWPKKKLLL